MTSALSRLLVVAENYPQLKSDQNFRDLQAQLEGTENRIAVARKRYIDAVQQYNTTVRQFPVNLTAMMFGYKEKPNFTVRERSRHRQAADGGFRQAGAQAVRLELPSDGDDVGAAEWLISDRAGKRRCGASGKCSLR